MTTTTTTTTLGDLNKFLIALASDNKEELYQDYISSEKLRREIYNKFLKKYIKNFYHFNEYVDFALSLLFFSQEKKDIIFEKAAFGGEYKVLVYLSNEILKIIRDEEKSCNNLNYVEDIYYKMEDKQLKYSIDEEDSGIPYNLEDLLSQHNINIFDIINSLNREIHKQVIICYLIKRVPIKYIPQILNIKKSNVFNVFDIFKEKLKTKLKLNNNNSLY